VLAEQSDRIFKERRNLAIGNGVETEILHWHKKQHFDFIYERYSLWSAAGARAARKVGIPLILEVNAPLLLEQQKYRKLVLAEEAAAIEAEAFREADLILAVSAEVKEYVVSKGGNPKTTLVQENGVDLNTFRVAGEVAECSFEKHNPIIGFSGSLKPWHGIDDMVEAHAILRSDGVECNLLFAGDGPMRSWIDGANIEHLIHVTGWVAHDEMPKYIRRMDIALAPYPKIQDFYFSPLKLFEYMACERPVIASDIGQIRQVISHGKSGLLSEPGNPKALASTIKTLLANNVARERLGADARDAMQGRSWRDCAARVIDCVEALDVVGLRRIA
jgi:glycosyltransferase involved in cell wall biosynthesis